MKPRPARATHLQVQLALRNLARQHHARVPHMVGVREAGELAAGPQNHVAHAGVAWGGPGCAQDAGLSHAVGG